MPTMTCKIEISTELFFGTLFASALTQSRHTGIFTPWKHIPKKMNQCGRQDAMLLITSQIPSTTRKPMYLDHSGRIWIARSGPQLWLHHSLPMHVSMSYLQVASRPQLAPSATPTLQNTVRKDPAVLLDKQRKPHSET